MSQLKTKRYKPVENANLWQHPMILTAREGSKYQQITEYNDGLGYTITTGSKHGLPTLFDIHVYYALMKRYYEQGKPSTIEFRSMYDLASELGYASTTKIGEKRFIERVRIALKRLTSLQMEFQQSWLEEDESKNGSDSKKNIPTMVFDDLMLAPPFTASRFTRMWRGERLTRLRIRVGINKDFARTFNSIYTKRVNFDLLLSFKTATAHNLYRFLSVNLSKRKPVFEIGGLLLMRRIGCVYYQDRPDKWNQVIGTAVEEIRSKVGSNALGLSYVTSGKGKDMRFTFSNGQRLLNE